MPLCGSYIDDVWQEALSCLAGAGLQSRVMDPQPIVVPDLFKGANTSRPGYMSYNRASGFEPLYRAAGWRALPVQLRTSPSSTCILVDSV